MNLLHLFDSIAQVEADTAGRDSRRAAFRHLLRAGRRVGAAAVPGLLASVFNRADASTHNVQQTVMQALQYALRVERLQAAFYLQGLNSPSLALTTDDRAALNQISADEQAHVQVLEGVLGAAALPPPDLYYFNKVYQSVFDDRDAFLAVAQALEDAGVRAYKGIMPDLLTIGSILEFAFNLHSIEARHASHIRWLRGEPAWIVGTTTTVPGPAGSFYLPGSPTALFPGEDNTSQGGLTGLYAGNNVPATRYAEAFDEPLDPNTVLNMMFQLFLV